MSLVMFHRGTADPEIKKVWQQEQDELKKQLVLKDAFTWKFYPRDTVDPPKPRLKYIGGVDISFSKNTDEAIASLVVLNYPDLKVIYKKFSHVTMTLPYIPGFLAFREVDFLIALIDEMKNSQYAKIIPQVILVDGNGILHQRGFGLACHLGVKIGIPTIGVAKKLFFLDGLTKEKIKKWTNEHLKNPGDVVKLKGDSGVIHGAIIKSTEDTSQPVYISPGHKISLETAIEIVKACCLYRVPEPIRQADLQSDRKSVV